MSADDSQDAIEFTYSHTTYRSIMVAGKDLGALAKATGLSRKKFLEKYDEGALLYEDTEEDENRVAAIRGWLEENENRLATDTEAEEFQDLEVN